MAGIGTTTPYRGPDAMEPLFAPAPPPPSAVLQAAGRLKGMAHRTPVLRSSTADE